MSATDYHDNEAKMHAGIARQILAQEHGARGVAVAQVHATLAVAHATLLLANVQ